MTLEEIVNNFKSAGQDYGQLFNNNPRMDATKQFGGRAINNINSAGYKLSDIPLDQLINRYR